jgi:hypothetical protein
MMNLPEIPVTAQSRDDCIQLYLERVSANRVRWPRVSILLTAYLAWPNDEERRNTFVATCLARIDPVKAEGPFPNSQELDSFGGVAAIAKAAFDQLSKEIARVDRKWLMVADIFQVFVDMAHDERAILRGGPSISKAIDLCELEKVMRGHSQLRGAWSEFRDVAHSVTAAAQLAYESLAHGFAAEEATILNAIWLAPDAVLALAHGLQMFGLQQRAIQKEQPILRPDKLWRIPGTHGPKNPLVVFRRLTDDQLAFLSSRRVAKKAGVTAKQGTSAGGVLIGLCPASSPVRQN